MRVLRSKAPSVETPSRTTRVPARRSARERGLGGGVRRARHDLAVRASSNSSGRHGGRSGIDRPRAGAERHASFWAERRAIIGTGQGTEPSLSAGADCPFSRTVRTGEQDCSSRGRLDSRPVAAHARPSVRKFANRCPRISRTPLGRSVEVAGIEPASFGDDPGLLRAQPACAFLGLSSHAGELLTGPVAVRFPSRSRDRTDRLSLLADARHRAEGTPGLTACSAT